MLRIGIVGASGYTGVELIRLLAGHPGAELSVVTSRQHAGKPLAAVFPSLGHRLPLTYQNPAPDELAAQADVFFTAVPHKTAMAIAPVLLAADKKVVDLSADFRLRDSAVYEAWYEPHTAPELLAEAIYGLPELYRDRIRACRLLANPGCYPTSVILALAPLLRRRLLDPASIIVDSKSGTSGAGRAASLGTLYCEVADGFRPYKVGGLHRHIPEMEQELSLLHDGAVTISFTPHLLPISRGILSTIYAAPTRPLSDEEVQRIYEEDYRDEYFVRVCPPDMPPATQQVRGSNFCDIGVKVDPRTGRLILMSAIDNIVKGAAGQAIQNMNLMCGFEETTGLTALPFFP